jgi:transposase, IS5 family
MTESFDQFVMKQQYLKVKGLGDRLELMKQQINWEPFRPLVKQVFNDNETVGGRPHTDELVIVRALLLQGFYGLSDPELEFQINDRLSFRNFLGFPETVPDFTTVWKVRERLKEAGLEQKIWDELQRQLNSLGYKMKKGVIQDASFIEADLGRKRHYNEKKAEKEGKKVGYSEKQLSHIDKDGSFSVKHGQVHYGYKSHLKLDCGFGLIRSMAVTTASWHDSKIDLVRKGDEVAYRDKGYVGTELVKGVRDMTMKRATKARLLNGSEQKRNKAISRVRAPGERPFSVIKRVFNGGRTLVKTLERVSIKEVFKAFGFNLYQLVTLKRKRLAAAM